MYLVRFRGPCSLQLLALLVLLLCGQLTMTATTSGVAAGTATDAAGTGH